MKIEKEKLLEESKTEKENLLQELILLKQKLKERLKEEISTEIEKSKGTPDLQNPDEQGLPKAEQQTSVNLNPNAPEFVPTFVITPPGN